MTTKGILRACIPILLLSAAAPARAESLTVDCDGGPGADFSSINAALSHLRTLSLHGHDMTIEGTCRETVHVYNFSGLTLRGLTGASIVDPGGEGSFDLLLITDSENIVVSGLALRGAGLGEGRNPAHVGNSQVTFQDCVFEGGGRLAGGGLWVQGLSSVQVISSLIQNNSPNGIRVDSGEISIDLPSIDPARGPTVIQQNSTGLLVRTGAKADVFGEATLRNNEVGIVAVDGSTLVFCCGESRRKVTNNTRLGMRLGNGSTLKVIGDLLVQANGGAGILLFGSTANLAGEITIRKNGGNGDPRLSGGIVGFGSRLEVLAHEGSEIAKNSGSGILLYDTSSATLNRLVIRDNEGFGVKVENLSTVALLSADVQIRDNENPDLSCVQLSTATGTLSGVEQLDCGVVQERSERP